MSADTETALIFSHNSAYLWKGNVVRYFLIVVYVGVFYFGIARAQETTSPTIVDLSKAIGENTGTEPAIIARSLLTEGATSEPFQTNLPIFDLPSVEINRAQVEDLISTTAALSNIRPMGELFSFEHERLIHQEALDTFRSAIVGTSREADQPIIETDDAFVLNHDRYSFDFGNFPEFQSNLFTTLSDNLEINNTRVFGGSQVIATTLQGDPYADAVMVTGNGFLCSGTLVSPNKVIYAAHCFCDGAHQEVHVGTGLLNVFHRANVDIEKSKSMLACNSWKSNIRNGDIAVLTLRDQITNVTPRKIASLEMVRKAASVRAAGVGRTESGLVGVKFIVDIVIATPDCLGPSEGDLLVTLGAFGTPVSLRKTYADIFGCSPGLELVAAGARRDTAVGDSGGPTYIFGEDGSMYLASVTSRGIDPSGGSGLGGIYVLAGTDPVREFLLAQGIPASAFVD